VTFEDHNETLSDHRPIYIEIDKLKDWKFELKPVKIINQKYNYKMSLLMFDKLTEERDLEEIK
jgi:hypothetical protein